MATPQSLSDVRYLMTLRTLTIFVFLFTLAFSCRTKRVSDWIVSQETKEISLKTVSSPFVLFVLQSGDTLKFSVQDLSSQLNARTKSDILRWGYSTNRDLDTLANALSGLDRDTVVAENLSAVDSKSLSGNLTSYIARERLLAGMASVALRSGERLDKFTYVESRDKLGGISGRFISPKGKTFYETIVALGE